ncbi:YacL family protein [Paraglaciecola marina]|uniref:YacL family protein n=1 Tax=Paraglaciecola marina TaxID=2500157 RepID=UPI00105F5BD2|nr:YacL family protein [Paraglaciecola marina]
MEYQFSYDLLGKPTAKCELDCELFGDWLSLDIANNSKQIKELLDTIQKLQLHQLQDYEYIGKTFHLLLDPEEVELQLNNASLAPLTKLDIEWHEQESVGCGLVDLQHLLEAWLDFIT